MINPFNPGAFDPSKMSPQTLIKLSQIIQELPSEQLQRMQQIMHNLRAGFDVTKDMQEFERGLPPGFKERLSAVMGEPAPASPWTTEAQEPAKPPETMREARLTILRGVAQGEVDPEDAERLLFPDT